MRSISISLISVVAIMVVLWFVGRLLGFHISLLWSLVISVVATLALNAPRLFSARSR